MKASLAPVERILNTQQNNQKLLSERAGDHFYLQNRDSEGLSQEDKVAVLQQIIPKYSLQSLENGTYEVYLYSCEQGFLFGFIGDTKISISMSEVKFKLYVRIDYNIFKNPSQLIEFVQQLATGFDGKPLYMSTKESKLMPIKDFIDPRDDRPQLVEFVFGSWMNYCQFQNKISTFNTTYSKSLLEENKRQPYKGRATEVLVLSEMKRLQYKQSSIQIYDNDSNSNMMYKIYRGMKINPIGWSAIKLKNIQISGYRYTAVYDVSAPIKPITSLQAFDLPIMAWDIETCTDKDTIDLNGKNENNHVFCIGIAISKGPRICITYVPSKRRETVPDDVYIICVPDEKAVIQMFFSLIMYVDPAIISGFNDGQFDWPIISGKIEIFGLNTLIQKDLMLERYNFDTKQSEFSLFRKREIKTSAGQTSESLLINIAGIIAVDLRVFLIKTQKTDETNLNFYLKKNELPLKLDISFPVMKRQHQLFMTNPTEMDQEIMYDVLRYCSYDSESVIQLFDKCAVLEERIQVALMSYTPLADSFHRADAIKVLNMIAFRAKKRGYVVPMQTDKSNCINVEDTQLMKTYGKYPGAYVVDPIIGVNITPVAALDFASLYPSIIMGYDLSPENMINDPKLLNLIEHHTIKFLMGETVEVIAYVAKRSGVYGEILEELFEERLQIKEKMKQANDNFTRIQLNAKQLALKIYMNTFYGGAGSQIFPLFDLRLAASVTTLGQINIKRVHQIILDKDIEIVYGDTDSVYYKPRFSMFEGHCDSIQSLIKRSEEIAKQLSKQINTEIGLLTNNKLKMVYEETLLPSFMTGKKKYFGLAFESVPTEDITEITYKQLLVKGIDFIKSDQPEIVKQHGKQLVTAIMNKFLQRAKNPPKEAFEDTYRRTLSEELMQYVVNELNNFKTHLQHLEYTNSIVYDQFIINKRIKLGNKGGEMLNFYKRLILIDPAAPNNPKIDSDAFIQDLQRDIRTFDVKQAIEYISLIDLVKIGVPAPLLGEKQAMVYIKMPIDKMGGALKLHFYEYANRQKLPLDLNHYIDKLKTTVNRILVCCFETEEEAKQYTSKVAVIKEIVLIKEIYEKILQTVETTITDTIAANQQVLKQYKNVVINDSEQKYNDFIREHHFEIQCIRAAYAKTQQRQEVLEALFELHNLPRFVLELDEIQQVMQNLTQICINKAIYTKQQLNAAASTEVLAKSSVKAITLKILNALLK